jgi:hypothetical protein
LYGIEEKRRVWILSKTIYMFIITLYLRYWNLVFCHINLKTKQWGFKFKTLFFNFTLEMFWTKFGLNVQSLQSV